MIRSFSFLIMFITSASIINVLEKEELFLYFEQLLRCFPPPQLQTLSVCFC